VTGIYKPYAPSRAPTINELAVAVGSTPSPFRHHLTNLQVEGLVNAERNVRCWETAPVYFLTEAGNDASPPATCA